MASTADTTNIISEWKDQLKDLLLPDFDSSHMKEELGGGHYCETSIVCQDGVSFVAKKIHNSVFSKDEFRSHFAADCLLMGKLRHPNIVQFLGVLIEDDSSPPILVTELFPLNLTTCLLSYPEIPSHSKYTILLETAVGLSYLHDQLTPPLVHGHLCPSNILLTGGMHVKISDCVRFGVGTPSPPNSPYQPPEETVAEAGDIFSMGDIMIHVILQKDVSPLDYKHHRNPENKNEPMILSEIKRRDRFLSEIEESHQLKELILKCLEEDVEDRPTAKDLVSELSTIVKDYKPEYQNILEMFVALGQLSLMKESVESLEGVINSKEEEIDALKAQMEPLKEDLTAKDDEIASQKEEMDSYKKALQSKEKRIKAQETGVRSKEALIKAKDREIAAKKQAVAAKESLLKSAQKRIDVLEQHVKSSYRKAGSNPHLPSLPSISESSFGSSGSSSSSSHHHHHHHHQQASPESSNRPSSGDSGLRAPRPYRGTSSSPDGFQFKSSTLGRLSTATSTKEDPKLAEILAHRQRKVQGRGTEGGDMTMSPQTMRKRAYMANSSSSSSTTPELRKILQKRKSVVEYEEEEEGEGSI